MHVQFILGFYLWLKHSDQPRGNMTWCHRWQMNHLLMKDDDNKDEILRNSPNNHRQIQFEFAKSMDKICTAYVYYFHRPLERKGGRGKGVIPSDVGLGQMQRYTLHISCIFCSGKEKVKTSFGHIPKSCVTNIKPNLCHM